MERVGGRVRLGAEPAAAAASVMVTTLAGGFSAGLAGP